MLWKTDYSSFAGGSKWVVYVSKISSRNRPKTFEFCGGFDYFFSNIIIVNIVFVRAHYYFSEGLALAF